MLSVFLSPGAQGYMRDGLRWVGRFIPGYKVGVHTLSLLASSRVAHDRATKDNYYAHQHNTQYTVHTRQ